MSFLWSLIIVFQQMETQLNLLSKETQEITKRCAEEAKKMEEDIQTEAHNLDMVEREAVAVLKVWLHQLFVLIAEVFFYKKYWLHAPRWFWK